MTRSAYMIHDHLTQIQALARSTQAVKTDLSQIVLLDAFATIAQDHGLSAPVVATMQAVPAFQQAATAFPQASLFNVIPEGKSSPRQMLGLESLSETSLTAATALGSSATQMTQDLELLLTTLPATLSALEAHITHLHTALIHCDLDVSLEGYVQVSLPSEQGMGKLFDLLETHVPALSAFNIDNLLAYPDQIHQEVAGLSALVSDLSSALGITLNTQGIEHQAKGAEYVSTLQGLEQHGMDKNMLVFFLDKSTALCQALQTLAARKDDLITGLTQGIADTPSQLEGNDDQYGATDHVTLMTCHTSLVAKFVEESLLLMGRTVSASQAILDRHQEYTCTAENEVVSLPSA